MANLKGNVAAGSLFPQASKSNFMTITRQRYSSMCDRLARKKLPKPTFTLDELRRDLLRVMGGQDDAPIQCRYCGQWVPLEEVAFDHCTPLSRLGSTGIDNLDYPCGRDNDRKGSMTVPEYQDFLRYSRTMTAEARKDVLSRLEKANKLAAAARRVQMLAAKIAQLEKELENARKGIFNRPAAGPLQEEMDPLGEF